MTESAPRLALADRRALAAYQENIYPGQLAAVQAAAGFPVPVEVRWLEIALPGYGASYADPGTFTDVFFTPLQAAFRHVGRDAMGREALAEGLTRIEIGFDDATAPLGAYDEGVRFEAGVLHLNFRPMINPHDPGGRADAIVRVLESKL